MNTTSPDTTLSASRRQRLHGEWVGWLKHVLPIPGLALGAVAVLNSRSPVATGGVLLANFLMNQIITRTQAPDLPMEAMGTRRLIVNSLFLLAFAWVAGPGSYAWVVAIVPMFSSLARESSEGRLRALVACGLGSLIGSALGGAPWQEVTVALVVLGAVSWLSWNFFEALGTVWSRALDREEALSAQAVKLQRALTTRQRFLATLSHEVRTPLNGILGTSELLRLSELDPDQAELVVTLLRSGKGLQRILDDILDHSRLEAGKLPLSMAPFDPAGLADEMGELGGGEGVDFHVRTEGLPERILGDEGRLRQVLVNLLGNAFTFTNRGRVELVLRWAQGRLEVEVHDTGIGIAHDDLERLLQPFEQGETGVTRSHDGTGLGLSIALQLIERMGGALQVRSELGEGSCFSFWIPAQRVAAPAASPPREDGLSGRVLIVEDNPVNMMVTSRLVQSMGCEVGQAADGVQALAQMAQQPFDLILMDCRMPNMDGLEATRRLRAQGHRLPILALTAGVTAAEQQACHDAGMDLVLAKPITKEALFGALAERLRRAA